MPQCTIDCTRQPMGPSVPRLHDLPSLCNSCLRGKDYLRGIGQVIHGVGRCELPANNLLEVLKAPPSRGINY